MWPSDASAFGLHSQEALVSDTYRNQKTTFLFLLHSTTDHIMDVVEIVQHSVYVSAVFNHTENVIHLATIKFHIGNGFR